MLKNKSILITIDVEDWFQVENFKPWIPFSTWDERELRVEKNVHRLLDLFDDADFRKQKTEDRSSVGGSEVKKLRRWEGERVGTNAELNAQSKELSVQLNYPNVPESNKQNTTNNGHSGAVNKQHTTDNIQTKKVKATFFVLGWIAEKLPHLVREIHARGHEVASHGYHHELCGKLPANELKKDLSDSKKLLEDIIGMPVSGYRAPSFSISDDVLKALQDCGYLYDSSYNSFGLHGRYGKISLNGAGCTGIARKIDESFSELPVSNLQIGGWTIPIGGGGYFRLLPTSIFAMGIKAALKRHDSYLFYAHPWEFDPSQPRVEEATASFKFRHYVNLKGAQPKLKKLIGNFSDCRFITCRDYLKELI